MSYYIKTHPHHTEKEAPFSLHLFQEQEIHPPIHKQIEYYTLPILQRLNKRRQLLSLFLHGSTAKRLRNIETTTPQDLDLIAVYVYTQDRSTPTEYANPLDQLLFETTEEMKGLTDNTTIQIPLIPIDQLTAQHRIDLSILERGGFIWGLYHGEKSRYNTNQSWLQHSISTGYLLWGQMPPLLTYHRRTKTLSLGTSPNNKPTVIHK